MRFQPSSEQKKTFLIVDPNTAERERIRQLIESAYIDETPSFIEESSCDAALDRLNDVKPDCCLVDYSMPAKSGLDFLIAARKNVDFNSIPVIVLADEEDESIAVKVMQNEGQDYLTKGEIDERIMGQSIKSAGRHCALQSKLYKLSYYDNLTGLLNRSLFMDRLQASIHHCNRYNDSCALIYMDINHFKLVNDTYGHSVGDKFLKDIADKMKKRCRVTDSIARLGGDEFAILLERITVDDANKLANELLAIATKAIAVKVKNISPSISMGIAYYPHAASNIQNLMRQADEATYSAKRSGNNGCVHFDEEKKKIWERRNRLESLLPSAIKNNDLTLFYQPIVSAQDGSICHVEALSRWSLDDKPVSPLELIEIIDHLDLFDAFHQWLINTSLKQLADWKSSKSNLRLCLNIPADQCHNDNLLAYLMDKLKFYQLDSSQIEIEVTETKLMSNPTLSQKLLASIQSKGVGVSVDDFGTGYSSMAYLTTLPLNTLKIDRQFISGLEADCGLEQDFRNNKIVEAIIALGRSLNLKTVAEGVETIEQYNIVRDAGCDYIQGYYFGRPCPGAESFNEYCANFPNINTLH